MLQKLLALVLLGLLVAQVFFAPQLRRLGKHVDRFIRYAALAIGLFYLGEALLLLFMRG